MGGLLLQHCGCHIMVYQRKNNQQDVAGHQPVLLVLPGSAPTAAEITFTGATGFGMLLRQIVSPFQ